MEEEEKKREITLADVIKFIGVIGVITPLLLGYFQYQRSVQQDKDNNFRVWVEKLSSEKEDERVAAATNLGTYLKSDDDYYEEVVDILVNTVSIELDYNVLNAIRGSLENVKISDRKSTIQKLLNIDRSIFIYDYPIGTRLDKAKQNLLESYSLIMDKTILINDKSIDTIILNSLKEDLKTKSGIKINVEKVYNELSTHQLLLTSFIGLFLDFSRLEPIEGLSFYQNSFNYLVWLNFNLPDSKMENSSFSSMTLSNIDLSRSKIDGTTFAYSNFSNCSFAESKISASIFSEINVKDEIDFSKAKFDDVFFLGADLSNSNFRGAVGLKPIYFYKVNNLEVVQFDDEFREELEKAWITDTQFFEYVQNSKLIKLRADELTEALKQL